HPRAQDVGTAHPRYAACPQNRYSPSLAGRASADERDPSGHMLSFILKRLASTIPALFLVITIAFFLMRVAPGGPFDLERPLEAKVMENLNRIYKLDRPLLEQYWLYLTALL